ncbi:MAG: dUTP diphosphatase [Syntrophobacterales bacterium]|jgi:dUTP pyrophosphatase|nr:dUTP diphosphatase [Syntrophobacterales bacterium]
MEELEVLISMIDGARIPEYATHLSSGVDLRACLDEPFILSPADRALISTGIHVSIPEGYEAEIRPRSGMANKFGVTIVNTPGTIDADYRGEIKVILINLGKEPFVIKNGDRIAQMVFRSVARARFKAVDTLPETDRGKGGFGSTGI